MGNFKSAKDALKSLGSDLMMPAHCVSFTIPQVFEKSMMVETELFDQDSLKIYARFNSGERLSPEDSAAFSFLRSDKKGGAQGDYSMGMKDKINNIVECLVEHPESKRAVIMINNGRWLHYNTEDAKCLREMHFYLKPVFVEDIPGRWGSSLHCVAFYRAQALEIMPKNLYFAYHIMNKIRKDISKHTGENVKLGSYSQFTTTLVPSRED
jgi:hypothetical protein